MNSKKISIAIAAILIAGAAGLYIYKNANHAAHPAEHKITYHCPMHPSYTSDKPGDCPICGMKLVPVETAPATNAGTEVNLTPEREQLIGVKTAEANVVELKKTLRASARVAYDTELYNTIAEYREALAGKRSVKESPLPDVQERADALIRAASIKLRQMGFSQTQIDELRKNGGNQTNLILGDRKGSVWVYAQIYESEAGLVKPGQSMEVTAPALPGKTFTGTVKSVDPILNAESRSLRVRAEVFNKEGLLRPEMFVNAKIDVVLGKKLAVPEEAVMDTGERKLVFVKSGPGKYQPREVVTGQEAEGYFEIVSGVEKGETVVTSANFLIDSESRLKSAISGSAHQH